MKSHIDNGRRSFLASATGASAALVAAASLGCQGNAVDDRRLRFASLGEAMNELDLLARAKELESGATWNWAQTLIHCAQSIEYSVTGFPQAKSELFQRTVGVVGYRVFAWRGRMTHDLAEPIPGAPSIAAESDVAAALARLRGAAQKFHRWTGPLQPHFAYGMLSKQEYDRAHAMHLANHFSVFQAKV